MVTEAWCIRGKRMGRAAKGLGKVAKGVIGGVGTAVGLGGKERRTKAAIATPQREEARAPIMQAQPQAAPAAATDFSQAIDKQRVEARTENERLTSQLESSRRKNAIGMRRAKRGNIFDEALPGGAPFAKNLGGGQ